MSNSDWIYSEPNFTVIILLYFTISQRPSVFLVDGHKLHEIDQLIVVINIISFYLICLAVPSMPCNNRNTLLLIISVAIIRGLARDVNEH